MNKKLNKKIGLTGDERFCPVCCSDFRGNQIPDKSREFYGNKDYFSRLIGIEIPGMFDGVSLWRCPDCHSEFPRVHPIRKKRAC